MFIWRSRRRGAGVFYGGWGLYVVAFVACGFAYLVVLPPGDPPRPWQFNTIAGAILVWITLWDGFGRIVVWDQAGVRTPLGKALAWSDIRRVLVEEVTFGFVPSLGIAFIKRSVPEFPVERVTFPGLTGFGRKRMRSLAGEFELLVKSHSPSGGNVQ